MTSNRRALFVVVAYFLAAISSADTPPQSAPEGGDVTAIDILLDLDQAALLASLRAGNIQPLQALDALARQES